MSTDTSPDAAARWRAAAERNRALARDLTEQARQVGVLADKQEGQAEMLEAGLTVGDVVTYQHYEGGSERRAVVLGCTGRAWLLHRIRVTGDLGERVVSSGPAPWSTGERWEGAL